MYVIKADGRREEYSEEKVIQTCMRAGLDRGDAMDIARRARSLGNNVSTQILYHFVLNEIDKIGDASVLFLREAVASFDPISFEKYVKRVLELHGYRCIWNRNIMGRFVEHQIDILAYKEKNYIVECKRHFNPHRFTGLGICLQVEARLNEIKEGKLAGKNSYNIDEAWIITNTKFSEHAKRYAKGVGMRLTGWRYDGDNSLDSLIESKKAYPITILKVDPSVHRQLINRKIFTLPDLVKEKPKVANIKDLIQASRMLLSKL